MIAALCLSIALCAHDASASRCAGIDALAATTTQRRAALDACAAAAAVTPIEFFLSEASQLTIADRRAANLGDVAAAWSAQELASEPIARRLIAMANAEGGATSGAQIVAARALLAIPPDLLPKGFTQLVPLTIELTAVPSKMAYDRKDFSVAPGQVVHIIFHNPDALEHNLIIVAPGALAEMGVAGDRMGQATDGKLKEFVPDSPKVLAVMGLVAPGKSQDFWFVAPTKPATYPFVCTYPSHWRTMNGKMKVVAPVASAPQPAPPAPQPAPTQ